MDIHSLPASGLLQLGFSSFLQHSEIQSFHQQQTQRVDMSNSPMKMGITSAAGNGIRSSGGRKMPPTKAEVSAAGPGSSGGGGIHNDTTLQQSYHNYALQVTG